MWERDRVDSEDSEGRLFQAMFHHSLAIKLLLDPNEGFIRDANQAACDFYGMSHEQLTGLRISDLNILPLSRIKQEMDAARREERRSFRFQHRLASGSIRDVEVFSSPIELKGQTLLLSIVQDVTARNDYERELGTLQDVVRNLPVGVYRSTMDQEGRFLSVNQEMLRITEAESVDALLETPVKALYADSESRKQFIKALESAHDWHSDILRLRSLKGRIGHYRVSVRKQKDDDGQLLIDGILEDINHLRASEESRQQLLEIIEATPAIIGISQPDGELIYLNQAGREVLGIGPHDALAGYHPRQVHTEQSFRTLTTVALPQALEHGHWTGEMCFRTPAGDEVPVQTTLIAHHDESGELQRVSAVSVDVSSQKERQQALERLAYKDPLTGLLNRRGFLRALRNAVLETRQEQSPLSVIMADLDHFKPINDNHGHPVGDEILTSLTDFLMAGRRRQDHVGRLGGEEFGIVLPGATGADAVTIADDICQAIASEPFTTSAGPIPVTLSLGVADYNQHRSSGAALIREADKALYDAKNAGRNCVRSR